MKNTVKSQYEIIEGDNLFELGLMTDNSIDSIVTDPPYGFKFMNKHWDYEVPGIDTWKECLRVLKPGGHLICFGGARTYHRVAVNIEDAGFQIRDQIMWLYGSGFPKSHNLKGENEGWGTALKPAHEPIVLARKSFEGSVAENVAAFGTGALNIDGCRVGDVGGCKNQMGSGISETVNAFGKGLNDVNSTPVEGLGRWPANVIHDGSDEVVDKFPIAPGAIAAVKGTEPTANGFSGAVKFGGMKKRVRGPEVRNETNKSASRFFYCAKASPLDREEGLSHLNKQFFAQSCGGKAAIERNESKVPVNDFSVGINKIKNVRNNHPTVKPTALMRYLCKLITPMGGVILDPFAGSGSTGKGAILEGFSVILIENHAEYIPIIEGRCAFAEAKAKAQELNDIL